MKTTVISAKKRYTGNKTTVQIICIGSASARLKSSGV